MRKRLPLLLLRSRRGTDRRKKEEEEWEKELAIQSEVRASGGIGSPAHARVTAQQHGYQRPGWVLPRTARRWSRS